MVIVHLFPHRGEINEEINGEINYQNRTPDYNWAGKQNNLVGTLQDVHQDNLQEIGDGFYDFCREHIGKSKRYLAKDIWHGAYNSKWRLIVPRSIVISKNEGYGI